jgi:two-component system OmpR family sensor kinase
MRGGSLRFRMIFLFCLVVGVLFAGTYVIIYSVFSREIEGQLDRGLRKAAQPIVADLVANPSRQDVFELDLPYEYFELLDASGDVLRSSKNLQGKHLEFDRALLNPSKIVFRTLTPEKDRRLRMAVVPFLLGKAQWYLAIAVPRRDTEEALETFRHTLIILWPATLLLIGLVALWYVSRSLRPIVNLTQNAAQLAEALAHPEKHVTHMPLVITHPRDEVGQLSQTFNLLFDNVKAALGQLRQFVTDASHELRTPLAVVRGETELILSEKREPEDYEKTLFIIENEVKLLQRIVDGLFTLSMADAGQLRLAKQEVFVDEILEEACEMALALARPKGITIEHEIKHEILYVGDEAFLRQLFLIFLENAVKYSPPNTRVRAKLDCDDQSIRVDIHDQGLGIPPEHLPHIFERFYRASPNGGGTRSGGLGLAIAQAIARALGGTIRCQTEVGHGSTFSVLLPVAPAVELESREFINSI